MQVKYMNRDNIWKKSIAELISGIGKALTAHLKKQKVICLLYTFACCVSSFGLV